MKPTPARKHSLAWLIGMLLAGACAVDAGNPNDKSGKKGSGTGSTVTLRLSDGPIDQAEKAILRATGVRFLLDAEYMSANTPREHRINFQRAIEIDVLDFSESTGKTLLKEVKIPPGRYQELRIILDQTKPINFVLADGRESLAAVPPRNAFGGPGFGVPPADQGAQPEFMFLNIDANLEDGQSYSFVADIDFRQSLLEKSDPIGEDYIKKSFPAAWDLSPYTWLFIPASKTSSIQSSKLISLTDTLTVRGSITNPKARNICFYSKAQVAAGSINEPDPTCKLAERWSPVRKSLYEAVGVQPQTYLVHLRDAFGNSLGSFTKDFSSAPKPTVTQNY